MTRAVDVDEIVELIEEATLSLPGSLAPDTDLAGVKGLDSMGLVSFLGLVRDVIGVEIAPKELVRCRTPRDVHAVIAQAAAR